MTTEQKIERKGYTLRCNMGYSDGCQSVASYSAMKNGKECARASSKTALLRQLTSRY
jgi:TPP-dependent pyruvate/acetoin dehydrogenase alpha subunit